MKPPKKIEDAWLIAQYLEGHKSAMALLVKRWHIKFCKQAYRYTNNYDSAKDIAQDAWVIILRKLEDLEHPEKFGNWALSIVTRKSIDWYRQHKRMLEKNQKMIYAKEASIIEVIDLIKEQDVNDDLKKAIALLSIEHRHVLKLFYIEAYGLVEISQILNISKGTVKSRLYYAREKLKETLKSRNHEKRI